MPGCQRSGLAGVTPDIRNPTPMNECVPAKRIKIFVCVVGFRGGLVQGSKRGSLPNDGKTRPSVDKTRTVSRTRFFFYTECALFALAKR